MVVALVLAASGVTLSFHGFPTGNLNFGGRSNIHLRSHSYVWRSLGNTATRLCMGRTHAGSHRLSIITDTDCRSVQQIKSGAARTLGEEKLPIAFYGLTYLPLILTTSVAYKYFRIGSSIS